MNEVIQLWLPVLAAAIFVFVASSLIHMVLKWHNSDYRKLANEDDVRAVIRAGSPAPGQYTMPHCVDMKEMQTEAVQNRFREGPVALMTVKANAMPSMGPTLGAWYVLNLVVALVAAAVSLHAFGFGADAACRAGCLGGILTFMSYSIGSVSNGIWMGRPWSAVAKDLLDAAIYGAVTGLAFWWLWPGG